MGWDPETGQQYSGLTEVSQAQVDAWTVGGYCPWGGANTMLEILFDILFQTVARAVGVTIVATFTWCASGFHKSYLTEWKRLFAKNDVTASLVDLLGLVVILATLAGVALAIYLALTRAF
jgi:hypothetical protein